MDFTTALQTAANAGAVSCMYAMIAVGLSLAFGVMGMANYAHGEFFMAGAYDTRSGDSCQIARLDKHLATGKISPSVA